MSPKQRLFQIQAKYNLTYSDIKDIQWLANAVLIHNTLLDVLDADEYCFEDSKYERCYKYLKVLEESDRLMDISFAMAEGDNLFSWSSLLEILSDIARYYIEEDWERIKKNTGLLLKKNI